MTKFHKYIVLFSILFLIPKEGYSQFINLQIRIEPEITAKVERELDFGELVVNSGQKLIGLGDINMGVFSIRALYTQNIYLSLSAPNSLRHSNPAIADEIPIDLKIAYNNTGRNIADNSIELENDFAYVPVYRNDIEAPKNIWQEMYLYVFGSLEVGDISFGEYFSEITLVVEYD